MSSAFKILLVVLGVTEVIIGFKMDIFTRKKYESIKVRNMNGLIKWEKTTTVLMGIAILLFASLSFLGVYNKYNTIFIIAIVMLMFVTHVGRKKFI